MPFKDPVAQKAYNAAYRTANREKVRAWAKAWAKANPEKVKARGAVCQARYRTANPGKVKAYHAGYRKAHSAAYRAATAKRKAAKLQATPAWADREKIAMIYAKAQEWGMVVDHVVPLKNKIVCGLHTWENLQLLCGPENSRKSNSHWPDMPENIRSKTK